MRVKLSVLFLILFSSNANGQINIEGPKVAKQKETITLTVKHKDVVDLKIRCYPPSKGWKLSRNYDDPTIIEINFTPTSDGIYYFSASGNKESKTEVGDTAIAVGDFAPPVIPTPDNPKPTPTVNPYQDDIVSTYMVSPDGEGKARLIKLYKEIQNASYASWLTAQSDLREKAAAITVLPDVKKKVGELLKKDTENAPYSNELKTKLFKQVVDSLESIK